MAVDRTPDDLDMNSYDALLPGGVINPDKLRLEPKVIEMVRRFATAEAQWSDQEVGTDDGIITSRSPKDIPAFVDKIIEELGEGRQDVRRVAAGTNPR